LKRQAESGLKVGATEEKSAFLTYLLSQTELSPAEVISNCVDLMLAAVETVRLLFLYATALGVPRVSARGKFCNNAVGLSVGM